MEFETEYPKVVLIYILPNVSGEHILYFKNVKNKGDRTEQRNF